MNHNVLITVEADFIDSQVVSLFVTNYAGCHTYKLDFLYWKFR